MAVFSHTRAFQNATPVRFSPEWRETDYPPAIPMRLVASWSTADDARLVRRWRAIAAASNL